MNYIKIYNCTISDGFGCRVSLYVSGCRNKCPGCQNPQSWDFNCGSLYTKDTENEILKLADHSYISGLTLCGGEPFEPENQRVLASLVRNFKEKFPDKTIWSYTGYEFEDLLTNGRKNCEVTDELLKYIDVLVVGPFISAQKDISNNNPWRGSRNQRLIDVQQSLKTCQKVFVKNIKNNE